jgi:hypothetical protein
MSAFQTHKTILDESIVVTCHVWLPAKFNTDQYSNWAKFLIDEQSWCLSDAHLAQFKYLENDTRLYSTGFLLIVQKIFQLAKVPIFDLIQVKTCEKSDAQQDQLNLTIQIATVHHLHENVYRHTVKSALDLNQWVVQNPPTVENRLKVWRTITDEVISPLNGLVPAGKSTIPVLRVAHALGIPFFHLGLGIYQLGWGSQSKRLARSSVELDSAMGSKLAQNKVITANLLRVAGLPAPVHVVVNTEQNAINAAHHIGFPVVVKPTDLDRGEGVTVDVLSEQALLLAYAAAHKVSNAKQVIIERQVSGVCHRLFVANGDLLYAVKRMPMGVFGDGHSSVLELVNTEWLAESEKPPWSRSEIQKIDDLALIELKRLKLSPQFRPIEGEFVSLRRIESTQWGGIDVDVKKTIHSENIKLALQAAKLFGLSVAGIDMISTDLSQPWHTNGAIINEVNFSPLFGGAPISRSYIPQFLTKLIQGQGKIPIVMFDSEHLALEFQQQQIANKVRCFLTYVDATIDDKGMAVVMPVVGLVQRVRALVLRTDVDAIAVVEKACSNEL